MSTTPRPRKPPLAVRQAAQTVLDYWTDQARRNRPVIRGPEDVRLLVSSVQLQAEDQSGSGVESVSMLLLDIGNRLLASITLSSGTVNQAPVYPREVVRQALAHDATALLLVHNHPGGQAHPSADDLQLTRDLKAALETVDVQLHDHLIIADGRIYSIAAGRII
jgi:DNA repair protein RadC